jgi:hypothetical protein
MMLTFLILMAAGQPDFASAQNLDQRSNGNCSPNINAGGSVTVVCPKGNGALDVEAQAEELARRRKAYRDSNGGCDLGTHRICLHIGPTGGGPGGYNAGCFCQSD